MPDYLGADQRKTKEDEKDDKPIRALDEGDIALLKTYGQSTYSRQIKQVEDDIQQLLKKINELTGIKESDTGLAPPALWDLAADKQTLQSEQPLQVARCTKIINADSEDPKYIINVKQFAKFVVDLSDQVAPTDIEEGMRVGVDRNKYQIHIPLPPKIDPTVTMMQVEEKPDVTYSDVGGCKEQIEKLREVVETPLLHPERFVNLGIEPPKGVLLFGPPGTGKTLCARAVANRTDACFIRVIGSELVQKYVGEGARMVRELFEMARTKKACLIFFDEIDAIGGARFDDGAGGDNEVQRTMLELINQLDGFDPRGNIKVLMATNRPDTLDPALMRPGRLDRKIEFSLPDLEVRKHSFKKKIFLKFFSPHPFVVYTHCVCLLCVCLPFRRHQEPNLGSPIWEGGIYLLEPPPLLALLYLSLCFLLVSLVASVHNASLSCQLASCLCSLGGTGNKTWDIPCPMWYVGVQSLEPYLPP
nr:26S proteasome regulatory subunit 7 isoform X1 [Dasypus novemcinctus]